jgi:hypothetical protein
LVQKIKLLFFVFLFFVRTSFKNKVGLNMKMEMKDWIGKKIFVQLKKGAVYTGVVRNVDSMFFYIVDKFGHDVLFAISDISKMKEEK